MAAPDWSTVDYYAVLGLAEGASARDVTRAFRRCAVACHPDTHPGDATAASRFLEVVAAYDVLGDEVTRREYDVFRRLGVDALDRSDVLSSGVRGYVYAAPSRPPAPGPAPNAHWRAWLVGAVAAAAVLFGAVIIATNGNGPVESASTSETPTSLAPVVTNAAGGPVVRDDFAYSFSDIDCSPGGWSGVFTNSELVPFDGELSAVAMQGKQVVARSTVTTEVAAGGQELIQFNWEGGVAPPVGAECRLESVSNR